MYHDRKRYRVPSVSSDTTFGVHVRPKYIEMSGANTIASKWCTMQQEIGTLIRI